MSPRHPPLESLRFLEACVRHGNFTRAAAELGVTPAAVSLRIRTLEAELSVALFVRSGPRLTPTEKGAALARPVAAGLKLIRGAVEDCRDAPEAVRISAAPTLANQWLAPRLARWHALAGAAPVRLDVTTELRPPGGFDLAIRTGDGDWPSLASTPLMQVSATPMLAPDLAARLRLTSPEDLAALPLLPHDDWPRWFALAGAGGAPLTYYPDDYPTHELDASAALAGAGVALLSPLFFADLIRQGRLLQPFAQILRGPARHHLLSRPGEDRPAVKRFAAWLIEQARSADD